MTLERHFSRVLASSECPVFPSLSLQKAAFIKKVYLAVIKKIIFCCRFCFPRLNMELNGHLVKLLPFKLMSQGGEILNALWTFTLIKKKKSGSLAKKVKESYLQMSYLLLFPGVHHVPDTVKTFTDVNKFHPH